MQMLTKLADPVPSGFPKKRKVCRHSLESRAFGSTISGHHAKGFWIQIIVKWKDSRVKWLIQDSTLRRRS
jgi:hypothetical protein